MTPSATRPGRPIGLKWRASYWFTTLVVGCGKEEIPFVILRGGLICRIFRKELQLTWWCTLSSSPSFPSSSGRWATTMFLRSLDGSCLRMQVSFHIHIDRPSIDAISSYLSSRVVCWQVSLIVQPVLPQIHALMVFPKLRSRLPTSPRDTMNAVGS